MDQNQLLAELGGIIDEVKTAVLVTCGPDNFPRGRWMTPAVTNMSPSCIYCFSFGGATKVSHINGNGNVAWLFQTVSLSKIIQVKGVARVIDNPALKSELMEILAGRLATFWKVNIAEMDFVVIETLIQRAEHFNAVTGKTQVVEFSK